MNGIKIRVQLSGRMTAFPTCIELEKVVSGKRKRFDLPTHSLVSTVQQFCQRQGLKFTAVSVNVVDKFGFPTAGGDRLQIYIGTPGACQIQGTAVKVPTADYQSMREIHPSLLKAPVNSTMAKYGFSPVNRFLLCASYTGFSEGREVEV